MGKLRVAALQVVLLTSICCVAPLAAQTVRGRVTDELEQPIAGAVVMLLGLDGSRVRAVFSGSSGSFVITSIPPGSYRVRAELLGRRTVETEPFSVQTDEELPAAMLALPIQPITLRGIDVAAARRCSVRRDMAMSTSTVFTEVEKALRAASLTSAQEIYRFTVTFTRRIMGARPPGVRRGMVAYESNEERVIVRPDPFNSLSPGELARGGYTRDVGRETLIYGPNVDVFLSSEFQETHCFALRREGNRAGMVGLVFEPVPGRKLPDIEGVLWIDEGSAELRTLEFKYVNLPGRLVFGEYTGFAEFQRLEAGTWIIRRWELRSPLLEEAAEVLRVEPQARPSPIH
jgi:hypothetical protein